MPHKKLLNVVRSLMRDLLRARLDGLPSTKIARAHGYADGYMKALLDAGLADKRALLAIVGAERDRLIGPGRSAEAQATRSRAAGPRLTYRQFDSARR